MRPKNYLILLLCCATMMGACMSGKKAVQPQTPVAQVQLAEYTHDWLRYKVFLQPGDATASKKSKERGVRLSIRVINIQDNTSPLRRLCSDLQDYNTYYEYLLNRASAEIYLQGKHGIKYPVFYAFENNYNAFPFETFNLGYNFSGREQPEDYSLVFVDRVFARDTIVFPLNNPKQ